jgi:hypothetical protein
MFNILCYGGGIQTIAMCVLVAQGRLEHPDAIIVADTGREMPTTWEYLDGYARPLMASVGLAIHRAGHELATVDVYGKNGELLLPVFTETGKFQTFCSNEWKARVVDRYAIQVLGAPSRTHVDWIGFSLEEKRRVKSHDGRRYPLLELMLTRSDCKRIIVDAGLPLPSKSRCWMCPHQRNEEWREVRERPELWQQAIALEQEIHDADERGGVWLHGSRVPLSEAPIDDEGPPEMVRQCGLGLCYV